MSTWLPPDQDPLADRTVADLVGLQIVTASGNTVGTIKDIVMDVSSGAVIAIASVGGVLAIGDKDIGVLLIRRHPSTCGTPTIGGSGIQAFFRPVQFHHSGRYS